MLTTNDVTTYSRDGYFVATSLFTDAEVQQLGAHYMSMHQREAAEQNAALNDVATLRDDDPLKTWPRLMMMHRRDDLSMRWLLDPRLNQYLSTFMGGEPFAVQTMHYFKPPGARGQALHQDQYYLRVQPGTCMAAWMALDDCDEENGCLMVVPGSHTWPMLCLTGADTAQSFTDVTVKLPEGQTAVPVHMKAGDVLFFNGQLVHGSEPNRTHDRFRRSLIGHYIAGEAEQVYKWYFPVYRMDGSLVELGESAIGDKCGVWVNRDGQPEIEFASESHNTRIFVPH